MVTKNKQVEFLQRFNGALWTIELGIQKDNPDVYYDGQVDLFQLCEEYIYAWKRGSNNGSK